MGLVHGTLLQLGLRLQNTLGVFKLFVFALISLSGILCLIGGAGIQVRDEYEKPNNFTWDTFWEGSGTGLNAFINGLYNVIWYESSAPGVTCLCLVLTTSSRSFNGYTTINSVLSEVRNPVRTLKLAAPLAMLSVTAVYLFINLSYFAVVSKTDILESRQMIALVIAQIVSGILVFNCFFRALYFRNLFGPTTERVGFCYEHTAWSVATYTIDP